MQSTFAVFAARADRRHVLLTLLLTWLLAPLPLLLATRASGQIIDDANFFSDRAERQANQVIDDIRRRYDKVVAVETYKGIPASAQRDYGGLREDDFYNAWIEDRGKATRADVMILLVRGDPSRVEVGASKANRESGQFTARDFDDTKNALLNQFRARDFDRGLLEGLDLIETRFAAAVGNGGRSTAPPPPRDSGVDQRPPAGQYPADRPAESGPESDKSGGIGGMGMAGMACLLVGVAIVGYMIWTNMKRRSAAAADTGGYGPGGRPPAQDRSAGGGLGGLGGILGGVLGGRGRRSRGGGEWVSDPAHPTATRLPPTGPASAPPVYGGSADTGRSSSGGNFDSGDGSRGGAVGPNFATNPDRSTSPPGRTTRPDRSSSGGNF